MITTIYTYKNVIYKEEELITRFENELCGLRDKKLLQDSVCLKARTKWSHKVLKNGDIQHTLTLYEERTSGNKYRTKHSYIETTLEKYNKKFQINC